MENKEFTKRFKDLETLTEHYILENSRLDYDSAQLLAIKKVIESKDTQLQQRYLGLEKFLDAISYIRDFDKERNLYKEDLKYIFFDSNLPEDENTYLNNISKKSRMFKRLIASRLQREMFEEQWEKYDDENAEWATVYQMAQKYIKLDASERDKEAGIRQTIEDIVTDCTENSKFKILREEPYLEYLSYKEKIKNRNYRFFIDEIHSLIENVSNLDDETYWDKVRIVINDNLENMTEAILSEKLRKEHFPTEGFKHQFSDSDEDGWDEDDD